MTAAPDRAASARVAYTAGLAATLVAFGSAFFALPAPGALDSAELAAVTIDLGVSHPPGHPAWHLLHLPWSFVPAGSLAFRHHLAAGAVMACIAALVPVLVHCVRPLTSRVDAGFACALALLTVASPGVREQADRSEVYGLVALAVLLILVLALRGRVEDRAAGGAWARAPEGERDHAPALRSDPGSPHGSANAPAVHVAGVAGVLAGIALATHHLIAGLAALPLLALLIHRGALRHARGWVAALVGLGVGSVPWAWLPLRGLAEPPLAWAWPTSLSELTWLVSARAFQATAGRCADLSCFGEGIVDLVALHGVHRGVVMLALAVTGWLWALRRARAFAVASAALAALVSVSQLLFGLDEGNPDVHGYYLVPTFVVAVWATLGGLALIERVPAQGRRATIAVATGLVLAIPLTWLPRVPAPGWERVPGGRESEALMRAFDPTPPDGVLVTIHFESAFAVWGARASADWRPDVAHLHAPWLGYDQTRRVVAGTSPEAASGDLRASLRALDGGARAVRVEADVSLPSSWTVDLGGAEGPMRAWGAPRAMASPLVPDGVSWRTQVRYAMAVARFDCERVAGNGGAHGGARDPERCDAALTVLEHAFAVDRTAARRLATAAD